MLSTSAQDVVACDGLCQRLSRDVTHALCASRVHTFEHKQQLPNHSSHPCDKAPALYTFTLPRYNLLIQFALMHQDDIRQLSPKQTKVNSWQCLSYRDQNASNIASITPVVNAHES